MTAAITFTLGTLNPEGMSHLSLTYLQCPVNANQEGTAYNPSSDVVQFSFMPQPTQVPQSADWQTGAWDADPTDVLYPYTAKILVGPPGIITTVASGSNGGEISVIASWSSPSAGILDVASVTGFPATGTVTVATSTTLATVTYAGTAAGQLTGCTYVSGSATGTVTTGGAVTLVSESVNLGIGNYVVYLKVQDNPQIPVLVAGQLQIS